MRQPKRDGEREYRMVDIPLYGEVGAGAVIPFTPRGKTLAAAIPSTLRDEDVGSVIVRGCSLEEEHIYDGDLLIFKKKFTKRECMFEAICVVFIIATGELVAKKLLYGGNESITLRASGGGVKDMSFNADDIEIRGIAIGFQRMIQPGRKTDPNIPF